MRGEAGERNIRVKKEIRSTRMMRVSDDESYDYRYDEFTSQGLNRGPKPSVLGEDGPAQPLQGGLAPFHNSILDSILQEKRKDLLGDLMRGLRGGRARNDTNPYDDGTETPRLSLGIGVEAGRVDGRPVNLPSLDQVNNLGTDSAPDTIERGAQDSMQRLDRDIGVSADGLGEGCSEKIRTVNELRVVADPGDAVVVSPLVLAGGVLGDNGGIAGDGGAYKGDSKCSVDAQID